MAPVTLTMALAHVGIPALCQCASRQRTRALSPGQLHGSQFSLHCLFLLLQHYQSISGVPLVWLSVTFED